MGSSPLFFPSLTAGAAPERTKPHLDSLLLCLPRLPNSAFRRVESTNNSGQPQLLFLVFCFRSRLSKVAITTTLPRKGLPIMASTLDHLAQLLNATLDAQHHRKGRFWSPASPLQTNQPQNSPAILASFVAVVVWSSTRMPEPWN